MPLKGPATDAQVLVPTFGRGHLSGSEPRDIAWVPTPVVRPLSPSGGAGGGGVRPPSAGGSPSPLRQELLRQAQVEANRTLLYNGLDDFARVGRGPQCVNLLLYLWAADPQGRSCPLVHLPHTLVVRGGTLRTWLYTDTDGQIKRQPKSLLSAAPAVHAALCADALGPLRGPVGDEAVRAWLVAPAEAELEAEGAMAFQYFDQEGLANYLNQPPGSLADGLLQQYLKPCSGGHSLLHVHWRHHNFVVSKEALGPARHGQHGWEAAHQVPRQQQAGGRPHQDIAATTQVRLREICESIVHHVYQVSPQKYSVEDMRLTFKMDSTGMLWLLYCSHLLVDKLTESAPQPQVRRRAYCPVVSCQGQEPSA